MNYEYNLLHHVGVVARRVRAAAAAAETAATHEGDDNTPSDPTCPANTKHLYNNFTMLVQRFFLANIIGMFVI